MKIKIKKLKKFFSIFLILFITLTNIGFFPLSVLALEKRDFSFRRSESSPLTKESYSMTEELLLREIATKQMETKEGEGKTKRLESFKQAGTEEKNYVEGEVLVKYKKNKINLETSSGRAAAESFSYSKSLEKKEDLKRINVSVLKIKDNKTVEEKIAELKNDPNVEYIQPNFLYYSLTIDTNDTYKDKLWGLDNFGQEVNGVSGTPDADIDAPEAWEISEGDENEVIVAVIDDGVAYNHPDLINNMWDGSNCLNEDGVYLGGCNYGYDYEDNDPTPLPTSGSHGTQIAGTIAAVKNNNKGIIGVAPNAKIMALKGYQPLPTNQAAKGINFAKHNRVKVINASWGGTSFDQVLYDAIDNFPGLFIAAAGNEGDNHESDVSLYPCDYDLGNIICVAATDQNDNLASFSDYGASSVDVGAPGGEHPNPFEGVIYSTVNDTNVFNEDFEGVVPPNIGNNFTQWGDNTWGTRSNIDNTNKAIFSDYAYWGDYQNNITSFLDSSVINLDGKINSFLQFELLCDVEEDWDFLVLQFYNGSDWETITAYTGSGYGFLEYPLTDYINSNFQFSFVWITDDSNIGGPYYGCYVDNIAITSYSDGSDEQYGFSDGTSMAAPHVAGLAGLVWGYKPELTYSQVKDIILSTGDDNSSLSGKIVTGKRINAGNALNSITPPVISNLQNATTTPTSTIIVWTTDEPATSKVTYSTSTPVTSAIVSSSTLVTSHSLELANLTASTTYYYYVESADEYGSIASSTEQSFTTLSAPDTIPPIITAPADQTFEATGPETTPILTQATSTDIVDPSPTITYEPHSFAVGTTTVTWTATDASGNSATTTSQVSITDLTPPTIINTPTDITQEAASSSGVVVNYTLPTATDLVDVTVPVTCTLISGSTFALGTTTVNCSATDSHSNTATSSFNVTVQDTTPPVIAFHEDLTFEATSPSGADATYTNPIATDLVDGSTAVSCSPVSGFTFALGTTTVTCLSTDSHSNTATSSFNVTVQDTTPPTIDSHANITDVEATSSFGAVVSYVAPTSTDLVDGVLPAECLPASGSTLALGVNTVTCDKTDAAGNHAVPVTFTITVVDTTNPVITPPGPQTFEATGPNTTPILVEATATDVADPSPVITYAPHSFLVGTTTVIWMATDASGNSATTTSNVIIIDTTLPVITLLGDNPVNLYIGDSYTDAGATALDDVDGDITADIVVGGDTVDTNATGTYIITYNVSDAAGNPATEVTRTVNVSVAPDLTPPVITLNGSSTVNLYIGDSYTDAGATALDDVDGDITGNIITVNPVDTSTIETYTVTYNVSDAAGNPAEEVTRTVNVNDTTTSCSISNGQGIQTWDGTSWGDCVLVSCNSGYHQSGNSCVADPSGGGGGGGGGGGSVSDNTAPTISQIEATTTATGATISWKTNESSISWVVYGTTTDYGLEIKTTSYRTSHIVRLTGLSPETTYHYKIKSKDSTGNVRTYTDKSFTTIERGSGGGVADINGDNKVDKYDFSMMMAAWGKTGSNNSDLNGDSKVDKYDFALLMANWGTE